MLVKYLGDQLRIIFENSASPRTQDKRIAFMVCGESEHFGAPPSERSRYVGDIFSLVLINRASIGRSAGNEIDQIGRFQKSPIVGAKHRTKRGIDHMIGI